MRRRLLLCLAALWLGAGCASYELTELPLREAGLYPLADRRAGISMAVDDLSAARRSQKFFGADLAEHGILPLELIVSNHGSSRITVGPADLLLLRGRDVLDPLPLEKVAEIVKDRRLPLTGGTAEQVEADLAEVALQESVLAPGETHHGVVFFDALEEERRLSRFFGVLRIYPRPVLKLHVEVTDLERRQRMRFGPFGVYR